MAIYSPCIDAGTDVSLTKDYDGRPVPNGSAPDIGAFEYHPMTGFIMMGEIWHLLFILQQD